MKPCCLRFIRHVRVVSCVLVLLIPLSAIGQQWSAISSNNFNSLNSGNIGIGASVTASDAKLTITGGASVWPLALKNSSAGAGVWLLGSSPTAWTIGGGKFAITNSTASDAALVINMSRNVGLSVTSPIYRLDVGGTVNASDLLMNGAPLPATPWTTSGSNIHRVNGSVSIGAATTPEGYKLSVFGKAVAEDYVVKLEPNWPDYVFADDFNLMTIDELEAFIDKNNHLPDVPTALEVNQNGIATGEMTAILLKKIEELTLQLIALNKEIESLKSQGQ